jgi:hypothetical protein
MKLDVNIMPFDAVPATYFCLVNITYNNIVDAAACGVGAALAPYN